MVNTQGMVQDIKQSFLSKLIDWKEFELFVADMYRDSEEVIVEHDVTEYGKSGAKRQVDVLVIRKVNLHSIKIIIECKRWKHKVDRQVIDVLASSVEDLNANKGVIFTTKGYEEGAIQYAKSKNIDIFVIRDVADDEWGNPGREVFFYLQMFNGAFERIAFDNPRFFSPTGQQLVSNNINISAYLTLAKDQEYPQELQLYSVDDNAPGPNLLKILINVRQAAVEDLYKAENGLFQPAENNLEVGYRRNVIIDFSGSIFRLLQHENGFIAFDAVTLTLLHSITQSKMEFDRAGSSDFVLMVENYITNQTHFISKSKEEQQVRIQESAISQTAKEEEMMKNGAVLKIMTDYFVDVTLKPETNVQTITI